VIDMNQSKATQFATLLHQQVREHRGIDTAAECENYTRPWTGELEEFRNRIDGRLHVAGLPLKSLLMDFNPICQQIRNVPITWRLR